MKTEKIVVKKISCTNCVKNIKKALYKNFGNEIDIKVNIATNTVYIKHDLEISTEQFKTVIKNAGYPPIKEGFDLGEYKVYISIVLTIPLLIGMFGHLSFSEEYIPMIFMNGYLQFILASIILFYCGSTFYIGAYNNLKNKILGMDFLVTLGSFSAYIYSIIELIFINSSNEYYFEITGFIITIVLIGKTIEHRAKSQANNDIESLINFVPTKAHKILNNAVLDIDVDFLEVNDKVRVLTGEKVPIDGVIYSGKSYFEESKITGESKLVEKGVGAQVFAGTINENTTVDINVEKRFSDSVINKIINIVEQGSLVETNYQKIADKVANIFVPIIILISLITFIITLINSDLNQAVSSSLAVILISCPCALGLATPTSIMVSNGVLANEGILYNGGGFFEIAKNINYMFFDKTGTLTEGKMTVVDLKLSEEDKLLLKSLEVHSTHPISKTIVKSIEGDCLDVHEFKQIKGRGIEGYIDDKFVQIGNIKMFDKLENKVKQVYLDNEKKGYTINLVYINHKYSGYYAVADKIKSEAKEFILNLKKRDITPIMITGDNTGVAKKVALELGISKYYAEVLPEEKSDIVKEFKKDKNVVSFVGDGVNDSLALQTADIGITVKQASDIAKASSDITLLNNNLNLIIKGIEISKLTYKNIMQNYLWAFSYNLIAIPLAAAGELNMVLAAIAMGFSSIIVVLNALRLKGQLRKKLS